MPRVEHPASTLVGKLNGFHFFGFDAAPCSQRVGFALAEKGLARGKSVKWRSDCPADCVAAPDTYTFREVSLIKHHNVTDEYAAIQPNMVVPALVRDGDLYIESMDIIDYLDSCRPGPSLTPADPAEAALCRELVEQGKALHNSVRHVTFGFSLGKLGKLDRDTERRLQRLEQSGSTERLADFYARFNRNEIDRDTFIEHLHRLEAGYAEQEQRLASDDRPFLVGQALSTADIIWAIKVLRLTECRYPFATNFPHLYQWFERIRRRPGFQQGVMARHRLMHHAFRLKAAIEHAFGSSVQRISRYAA